MLFYAAKKGFVFLVSNFNLCWVVRFIMSEFINEKRGRDIAITSITTYQYLKGFWLSVDRLLVFM